MTSLMTSVFILFLASESHPANPKPMRAAYATRELAIRYMPHIEKGPPGHEKKYDRTRQLLDYMKTLGYTHALYHLPFPSAVDWVDSGGHRWHCTLSPGQGGETTINGRPVHLHRYKNEIRWSLIQMKEEMDERGIELIPYLPGLTVLEAMLSCDPLICAIDRQNKNPLDGIDDYGTDPKNIYANPTYSALWLDNNGENSIADCMFREYLELIDSVYTTHFNTRIASVCIGSPEFVKSADPHRQCDFFPALLDSLNRYVFHPPREPSDFQDSAVCRLAKHFANRIRLIHRILGNDVFVLIKADSFVPTDWGGLSKERYASDNGDGLLDRIKKELGDTDSFDRIILCLWRYSTIDGRWGREEDASHRDYGYMLGSTVRENDFFEKGKYRLPFPFPYSKKRNIEYLDNLGCKYMIWVGEFLPVDWTDLTIQASFEWVHSALRYGHSGNFQGFLNATWTQWDAPRPFDIYRGAERGNFCYAGEFRYDSTSHGNRPYYWLNRDYEGSIRARGGYGLPVLAYLMEYPYLAKYWTPAQYSHYMPPAMREGFSLDTSQTELTHVAALYTGCHFIKSQMERDWREGVHYMPALVVKHVGDTADCSVLGQWHHAPSRDSFFTAYSLVCSTTTRGSRHGRDDILFAFAEREDDFEIRAAVRSTEVTQVGIMVREKWDEAGSRIAHVYFDKRRNRIRTKTRERENGPLVSGNAVAAGNAGPSLRITRRGTRVELYGGASDTADTLLATWKLSADTCCVGLTSGRGERGKEAVFGKFGLK